MLNEVESSLTIWDVFWTLFGHYNTVLIWQDILWYLFILCGQKVFTIIG